MKFDVEVITAATTPAMRFLRSALVSCLALLASVLAKSSSGDKVLVLLDPSLDKANYSIFFNGLESES